MIPLLAVLIGLALILILIRFVQRLAVIFLVGGLIVFVILVVLFLGDSARAATA